MVLQQQSDITLHSNRGGLARVRRDFCCNYLWETQEIPHEAATTPLLHLAVSALQCKEESDN